MNFELSPIASNTAARILELRNDGVSVGYGKSI